VPPVERKPEEDAIDPATLPPLESLGPDSDYTAFLRKGVPEALKLAALRKAWMSDPFIRDFRSPAIEYGWDFTTPDYSLRATDDVEKLLDRILPRGEPAVAPASEPPQATPAGRQTEPSPPPAPAPPRVEAKPPAPQPAPAEAGERPLRRKHGGALPG
jgi:hypothetical protein